MSTQQNESQLGIEPLLGAVASIRQLVQKLAGQRLPAERELAASLKISRPRLRAILSQLQTEGLVESRRGSGTYSVADRSRRALRRILILVDERLKLGDDPFFSALLECLQSRIQAAGIRCSIERTNGNLPLAFPEDAGLTLGLAGEMLIASQRAEDPPLVGVLLGEHVRPNRRASVFQLLDRDAGALAANRLHDAGCRDLAFVGRQDIAASSERYAGAAGAVGTWNDGTTIRFFSSPLNYAAGLQIGREIELVETAGLIATNDWLAVGLRMGLQQRAGAPNHATIPIVSFDGLPLTADPALQIASLAMPLDAIATDAVAELQRLYGGGGAIGRVVRYPLGFFVLSPQPLP